MDTDGLARSWPWNLSCRMTSIEKLDCIFVSLRVVYNTSQRRSWGHHNVTNNTNVLLIRTPFMNDLLFIILIHSHVVDADFPLRFFASSITGTYPQDLLAGYTIRVILIGQLATASLAFQVRFLKIFLLLFAVSCQTGCFAILRCAPGGHFDQ